MNKKDLQELVKKQKQHIIRLVNEKGDLQEKLNFVYKLAKGLK